MRDQPFFFCCVLFLSSGLCFHKRNWEDFHLFMCSKFPKQHKIIYSLKAQKIQNLSGHTVFLECSSLMTLKVFASGIDLFQVCTFLLHNLSFLRKIIHVIKIFKSICKDLYLAHRKFLQLNKSICGDTSFVISILMLILLLYIFTCSDFFLTFEDLSMTLVIPKKFCKDFSVQPILFCFH